MRPNGRRPAAWRRLLGLTAILLLVAAVQLLWPGAPDRSGLAAPAPVFDPLAFFAGASTGEGTLRIVLHRAQPFHVASHGQVLPDGTLVLDQRIQRAGAADETRQWHIHRAAGGGYAGTLSDAEGPVAGDIDGNCLHLRFAMPGGLDAEQWLYLAADGQSALNRMTVRKWGLTVAAVEETIRRGD